MNLRKVMARDLRPGDLFFTGETDHYDMVTCAYVLDALMPDVVLGFLDAGALREMVLDEHRKVFVVNMECDG